jgi:hypothetical protein
MLLKSSDAVQCQDSIHFIESLLLLNSDVESGGEGLAVGAGTCLPAAIKDGTSHRSFADPVSRIGGAPHSKFQRMPARYTI